MEILGIGAPELIFVIIIALIVLGPKDMQKAGRTLGRWLNQLVRSDGWKAFQQTSREIRNLPNNLMRQANMELAETEKEIRKATDFRIPPASPPSRSPTQPQEAENSIRPPSAIPPETQADAKPSVADGVEGLGSENPTQGESPSARPSQPQTLTQPAVENGIESNGVESSAPGEPASVQLPDAQTTNEPDAEGGVEQKPDVNTTDQDA